MARFDEVGVDSRTLGFCVVVALSAVLISAWLPARRAATISAQPTLQSRGIVSIGQHRLRNSLVVAEVALTVPLLVAAGLLVQTMVALQQVDLGFRPEAVTTFDLRTPRGAGVRYQNEWFLTLSAVRDARGGTAFDPQGAAEPLADIVGSQPRGTGAVFRDIEQRLGQIPGVESVGFSVRRFGGQATAMLTPPSSDESISVDARFVSTGFFDSMQTPLLAGRGFAPHERIGVVMLDRRAADDLRQDASPVGQIVVLNVFGVPFKAEIIGVVESSRSSHDAGQPLGALFLPAAGGALDGAAFNVRTGRTDRAVLQAIEDTVRSVEPTMVPMNVSTLEEAVAGTRARESAAVFRHRLLALNRCRAPGYRLARPPTGKRVPTGDAWRGSPRGSSRCGC